MKKHIKLAIFLVLILVMAVSLFGCGSKIKDNGKTPRKQTEQKKPDKWETPEERRDERIERMYNLRKISDAKYQITKYKGEASEVIIPSEYKDGKITSIGREAFKGVEIKIEKVTMPTSLETIEDEAFADTGYKFSSLKEVNLNEGLKEIGRSAFEGIKIESITIPSTVETIGSSAFKDCYSLESVTLRDGIKYIEEKAFNLTAIKSIEIPSSVKRIGRLAFVSELEELTLNEGLESIEGDAFNGTKLRRAIIPKSVKEMGEQVFSACPRMWKIFCRAERKPEGWSKAWCDDGWWRHTVVWGYTG